MNIKEQAIEKIGSIYIILLTILVMAALAEEGNSSHKSPSHWVEIDRFTSRAEFDDGVVCYRMYNVEGISCVKLDKE